MLRGGSGRSRGPALKGIWDELRDTVPPTPHDGVSQPRTCRQTSSPVSPRLCRACPALRGPPFRIGPQPHCVPAPACRPSRGQRCAQLGSPWMDARAPVGSPHCLIWGSRLRKVRGGVPSDLFKGLAASRLPPPLPPTPPASPSVASFLSLYRIRLPHCSVPSAGNNCSRPDRLC